MHHITEAVPQINGQKIGYFIGHAFGKNKVRFVYPTIIKLN